MREMIILGAGASVEAGVPDTVGMTKKIVELFARDSALAKYSHVLRFAVGGLLFQKGVKGENPFDGVNIEEVFNAIQILANRQTLEAAPFMGSWHPLVEELDVIKPGLGFNLLRSITSRHSFSSVSSYEIDRALEDMMKGRRSGRSVGDMISNAIRSAQPSRRSIFPGRTQESESKERPGEGQIFEETNDQMIRKLVDLVWIESAAKVVHLKPLLDLQNERTRVIATLNYDNGIELAGHSAGVTVETGIDSMASTGRFPEIGTGVYLLKLHGSIDWSVQWVAPSPERPLQSEAIQRVTSEAMRTPGFRPAVIFGQRNKLTARGPFLGILGVFREELNKSDSLTVIGYSFRDEHVNEYVAQWMNGDPKRKLRIINGEKYAPAPKEFAHDLMQLKGRVEVIPACASTGIRDCFSQAQLPIQTEPQKQA